MAAKPPASKAAQAKEGAKLASAAASGNVAGAVKAGAKIIKGASWKQRALMLLPAIWPVLVVGAVVMGILGASLVSSAREANNASIGAGNLKLPDELVETARDAASETKTPWQLVLAVQVVESNAGSLIPGGGARPTTLAPKVTPPVTARQDGAEFAGLSLIKTDAVGFDPNDSQKAADWLAYTMAKKAPKLEPENDWFAGTAKADWTKAVASLPLMLPLESVPPITPAPSCAVAPNGATLLIVDDTAGDPAKFTTPGLEVVSVGHGGLEAVTPLLAARAAAGTALPARVVVWVGTFEPDAGVPHDEIAAIKAAVPAPSTVTFVRPRIVPSAGTTTLTPGQSAAATEIATESGVLDGSDWPKATNLDLTAGFNADGSLTDLGLTRIHSWTGTTLCALPQVPATTRPMTRDAFAQKVVAVAIALTTGEPVSSAASATASTALAGALDIPPNFLALYLSASASECPGLRWQFLAAIGFVETNHGRFPGAGVTSGENASGAAGPMQFIRSTWTTWGTPNIDDRYDPALAIPASARFFCALGAAGSTDVEFKAASDYNVGPNAVGSFRAEGDSYAAKVLAKAAEYADKAAAFGSVDLTGIDVSGRIGPVMSQVQVLTTLGNTRYSQAERFNNFLWTPTIPLDAQQVLDCSSFAAGVYKSVGVNFGPSPEGLPFNAQTRSMILWGWTAGRVNPADAQPGDWVFTRNGRTDGSDEHTPLDPSLTVDQVANLVTLDGHVAVFLGNGRIADANVASGSVVRGPDGSGIGTWAFDMAKAVVVIRPLQVPGVTGI